MNVLKVHHDALWLLQFLSFLLIIFS